MKHDTLGRNERRKGPIRTQHVRGTIHSVKLIESKNCTWHTGIDDRLIVGADNKRWWVGWLYKGNTRPHHFVRCWRTVACKDLWIWLNVLVFIHIAILILCRWRRNELIRHSRLEHHPIHLLRYDFLWTKHRVSTPMQMLVKLRTDITLQERVIHLHIIEFANCFQSA